MSASQCGRALRRLGVEAQAPLAAVHLVPRAHPVPPPLAGVGQREDLGPDRRRPELAPAPRQVGRHVAAGPEAPAHRVLHLDHVDAEVAERAGGQRAGPRDAELDEPGRAEVDGRERVAWRRGGELAAERVGVGAPLGRRHRAAARHRGRRAATARRRRRPRRGAVGSSRVPPAARNRAPRRSRAACSPARGAPGTPRRPRRRCAPRATARRARRSPRTARTARPPSTASRRPSARPCRS